ncbi:hypothetical protein TNCV_4628461 [Trichonephila clavipes]|nr:hypothetical protein TNCV_4628461 [Trichonephila clavipes]
MFSLYQPDQQCQIEIHEIHHDKGLIFILVVSLSCEHLAGDSKDSLQAMKEFSIFSCLTSAASEIRRSTSITASGPIRTFRSLRIVWRKKCKRWKNTRTNLSQEIRKPNWTNTPNVT